MFKGNNKDTRTYFTPCSSVSIVNFEQLNAGCVKLNTCVTKIFRNQITQVKAIKNAKKV